MLDHTAAVCTSVSASLAAGAAAYFKGLLLVVKAIASPRLLQSPMLMKELLLTPVVVTWVLFTSGSMWVLCLPLKRWLEPSWTSLVQISCLIALEFMRHFGQLMAPRWFFYVMSLRDQELSDQLSAMPIVYGLRERVKRWFVVGLLSAAAVVGLVFCAPLLGHVPVLALLAGTIFATWQTALAVVFVAALLMLLLGGSAYVYSALKPFLRLFDFDPTLCWIALFAVALRFLSVASIGSIIKGATVLYYSCTLMTSNMLSQYGERLSQSDWERFQRRHCWEMFGFGLPIWALMQCTPMTVAVLLQAVHGASAVLLADLLSKDVRWKRAPDV